MNEVKLVRNQNVTFPLQSVIFRGMRKNCTFEWCFDIRISPETIFLQNSIKDNSDNMQQAVFIQLLCLQNVNYKFKLQIISKFTDCLRLDYGVYIELVKAVEL